MPNSLVLHALRVSSDWALQFNVGKCCVLHLGPNSPMANYTIYNPTTKVREQLENRAKERDLGVIIDDKLKFHSHVQHVVSRAGSSHGLLKRTINSRQASMFIKLYKALVRPHLDFGLCRTGPSYQLSFLWRHPQYKPAQHKRTLQ